MADSQVAPMRGTHARTAVPGAGHPGASHPGTGHPGGGHPGGHTSVPRSPLLDSPESKRRTITGAVLGSSSIVCLAILVLTVGHMIDTWLGGTNPDTTAWVLAITMIALAAITGGMAPWFARRSARLEESRLRAEVVAHVHRRGPALESNERSGATVGLAMDEAPRVTEYRQAFMASMLAAIAGPIVVLVLIALAIDILSALILALLLPLIPLAIKGSQRLFRKASTDSRRARGRLAASYLDAIQGLTTYRLLNAAPRAAAELAHQGEANRRGIMRLLAGNQVVILAMDGVFSLTMVTGSVLLAGWRLSAGAITPGEAIALVLLALLLLEPLDKVGSFFYLSMGGKAAEGALSAHFAKKTQRPTQSSNVPEGTPTLTATNLTFAWPRQRPTLSNLDLAVAAGERVAITGPSGCGKTTLLNVLTGTLDPSEGEISLNGHNTKAGELRAASGVVNQSTWLFTGTIADNLRIGNPEASADDMWNALDKVALAADVRAMPAGLDTQVGERGGQLSGGQAQRLSLARALVSGRKLLVLDEPTAHVDLASEQHIMEAIAALGRDYTVLIVTHRRSLAALCDRVLTMSDGQVSQ